MTSTYQAAVLLQFNSGGDSISYDDLKAGTKLDDDTLKPILAHFVKAKVLTHADGVYDLNLNFKSKKVCVVLRDWWPTPSVPDADERTL
jgi:cullin 1